MLKTIKSAAKGLLGVTGLRQHVSPAPHILRILGGNKMIGADVGAAGWLPEHWQSFEGGIQFLFFEPHPESYQKLVERVKNSTDPGSISVVQTALSGTGGVRTLHLLNTPTGSSLLPVDLESEFVHEEDSYIFPIREEQVDTRTLADVLDEKDTALHILKLDVQGAELEILEGMGEGRRNDLVMVEAEINMAGGGSKGAPTFTDIEELLTASDMRLYSMNMETNYRKKRGNKFWYHEHVFRVYNKSPSITGRVWEVDAVYFKDYRALLDQADVPQIRRLIVALCGYRFFSEAYFIVETCQEEKVIDSVECKQLLRSIVEWHRDAANEFWYGRGSGAKWFRALIGAG